MSLIAALSHFYRSVFRNEQAARTLGCFCLCLFPPTRKASTSQAHICRALGVPRLHAPVVIRAHLRIIDRRGPHPVWPKSRLLWQSAAWSARSFVPLTLRRGCADVKRVVEPRHACRDGLLWHPGLIQAAASAAWVPAA